MGQKSYLYCVRIEMVILALLFFIFTTYDIAGQNSGQKVTRQAAMNAFTMKNFELAFSQFTELSANYPADPLYKYYCGACLVESGKEPARASKLLREAAAGSGAIRSVPPDCLFYLGRALQMSGKYPEAIEAYNRFTSQAGKKVAKELNVSEYIRQCNDGKGKIISDEIREPEVVKKDTETINVTEPPKEAAASDNVLVKMNRTDSLPADYDIFLGQTLESRIKADSVGVKMIKAADKPDNKIVGTRKDTLAPVINPFSHGTPVFSEFYVKQKQVHKANEKVAVDPEVPAGLIYRIQVAVFRNPVSPSYFKGIEPVQGFRNKTTGITTFYAGRFRKSADAGRSLQKVKSLGFRDAFVVAIMDKKIISNDRAAVLEKEWGVKPLLNLNETVRDTVPPTLVFRVEVKRTQKPLPEQQVDAMRKMAANRGFDIINSEPKLYIYLIGRFFSFKSATEFTDLLIRNGYGDAKVVAWLGKREIPVETAKQLFDEQ